MFTIWEKGMFGEWAIAQANNKVTSALLCLYYQKRTTSESAMFTFSREKLDLSLNQYTEEIDDFIFSLLQKKG